MNWQDETYAEIDQELNQRKIRFATQEDRLRRGYTPRGSFTTKEAYRLLFPFAHAHKDNIWTQIWQPGIWHKISTFLSLLSKKHILTWDNLLKRGFIGPSRCPNHSKHAEDIPHLLDTYIIANFLWEKIDICCRRTGRIKGDVINTIRHWPIEPFNSNLLNTLWSLLLGFILWTV